MIHETRSSYAVSGRIEVVVGHANLSRADGKRWALSCSLTDPGFSLSILHGLMHDTILQVRDTIFRVARRSAFRWHLSSSPSIQGLLGSWVIAMLSRAPAMDQFICLDNARRRIWSGFIVAVCQANDEVLRRVSSS